MPIRNIVFDLGGVLIDWNPRYVYRQIFDTEEEVDNFLSNITVMEWNVQQDAGRTLSEATQILIAKHPKWKKEIEAYYGRWEEMLGGPIDGTVDILKKCIDDERYRVLALTNWSAETFPIAQKHYEFLSWFEGIVVSGEEKCIKPDPTIYNILMNRYSLIPEQTIFIDDNPDNISAANELGINGILFTSPEALEVSLRQILME